MALLLNAAAIEKGFGDAPLFSNLSLPVEDGARIGVIGPNGSGKSTLLQILAGLVDADRGDVAVRKRVRLVYAAQESRFAPGLTVGQVVTRAHESSVDPDAHTDINPLEILGRAGFDDLEKPVDSFSGGWRKRMAIVEALAREPDLLLLDEPTNHLDLVGIEWLESTLSNAPFGWIAVSHDRYFLENTASEVVEINRAFEGGMFRAPGNYSAFLEKKADHLHAQAKRQESLENRVRTEMEWLRRGPKARTTKSKARIGKAHELISELQDVTARTRTGTAGIDFSASDRRTKRLVELEKVSFGYGERPLFENLDFVIAAGTRVGLVGPNGSGKSTLLRLMTGELQPSKGEVRRADVLRTVYFDQNRQLDPNITLRRALAPDGDSVIYQDRVIHVAAWAARFLFTGEQLNQQVSRLSGGERARVLIARLMLEPADVLLLDEPTNDLDIPTLEVLEESLLDFKGALVLITHDRYLLDRVSTVVLGLDGRGSVEAFADFSQWDAWQQRPVEKSGAAAFKDAPARASAKKKLSYLEAREYLGIEQLIADAESTLQSKRALLEDGAVVTSPARLQEAISEVEQATAAVEKLMARWMELEAKQNGGG